MKLKKFSFKSVNSTNSTAINIIKKSNVISGIVISDNQKRGRGQYGNRWISYKGNLFVSIFFTIDKMKISLKKITKINCYLIKKSISLYCKNKIIIKHPNDLMINKKKICGILQETFTFNDHKFIIIGIGINLIKNPEISNYPTSNLLSITNIKINKNKITLAIKKMYEKYIPKLLKDNITGIGKFK
tara:strand:+ start:279 stop:839 length:561 start_codon:yes stop_codon:yes gene_type:complete